MAFEVPEGEVPPQWWEVEGRDPVEDHRSEGGVFRHAGGERPARNDS